MQLDLVGTKAEHMHVKGVVGATIATVHEERNAEILAEKKRKVKLRKCTSRLMSQNKILGCTPAPNGGY